MIQRSLFRKSHNKREKYQGMVPRGDASVTLWSVSVEAAQETCGIFILADIGGQSP